ncbi:MAG: ATP-binding protein [Thermoanaerobaculia bacterium]
MRHWSFRGLLMLVTVGLVLATVVALELSTYAQLRRLSREEARARAAREVARVLERFDGRMPPASPAALQAEIADWSAVATRSPLMVRFILPPEAELRFADERAGHWRAAFAGEAMDAILARSGDALAAAPLRAAGGEVLGVVEVTIPATDVVQPLRRFLARTVRTAAIVIGVAILLSILLGSRLARPVADLARRAAAMGEGDLASPLPLAGGREVRALSSTLEEMRRNFVGAEAELEKKRDELAAVLGGIAEGVYAVDRDRRVLYLNPPAARMLGIAAEQAVGRFCGDLLRPRADGGELPCEEHCPILDARFRGPTQVTERIGGATGDGPSAGERTVVLRSSPPSAGIQVQVMRDESAVEAAHRARDLVVADLAHELKTPLAAQAASLELLRDRLGEADPELVELAVSAESGTLRLRRLIENLLESIRIESGQLAIRRLAIELDEVLEEACEMTRPLLARRRQTLEVEVPFPLPPLHGDPQRLVQVFVNLLSNASKFAPEATTIRVAGEVTGAEIRVRFEDEGPGFPSGADPGRTGRFERWAAKEPAESGSGLGLWIARSIVERHGGTLTFDRRDQRTGVSVTLPLEAAG